MMKLLQHVPHLELRAALVSVAVGIALATVKFVAYFLTGSAAVFSDAMESVVNVAASGVAAYALAVAHAPADREHPYGHGKIEFMSAGFEGGMILLAAIVITVRAVDTLLFHQINVEQLGLGTAMVAGAMVVNGVTGLYLLRTGRRHGSMTLEADGLHLLSDAITSIVAVAALLLVMLTGRHWIDPAGAIIVATYIAVMGIKLLRRSAAGLMDEQDHSDEKLLRGILDSHIGPEGRRPRICSYHKLRHRHSGRYHWVDFHIMIPSQLTVDEGHTIASAIEYEIEQSLGEGNATAHIEPCPNPTCRLAAQARNGEGSCRGV